MFSIDKCVDGTGVEFNPTRAASNPETRLNNARRSFATRRVDLSQAASLTCDAKPENGDVVLARVEKIGQHEKLESPCGRRQEIYVGDEIVVAYGNRYAPEQFDAVVPDNLELCDLVAGGGIAAITRSKHNSVKAATKIQPIGLLTDVHGKTMNLRNYALGSVSPCDRCCPVIVIVGTSMSAGKTTTAAKIIRGLHRAGLKVGAAKITGTGSGGDVWSMIDAGASVVLDFTDMGIASTAGIDIQRLEVASLNLFNYVKNDNDIAIIEIADGIFQRETSALLLSKTLRQSISKIVLAAADAAGAAFGAQWLKSNNLPLSFIAGRVNSSPLGLHEAEMATGINVATLSDLEDPIIAPRLCLGD